MPDALGLLLVFVVLPAALLCIPLLVYCLRQRPPARLLWVGPIGLVTRGGSYGPVPDAA